MTGKSSKDPLKPKASWRSEQKRLLVDALRQEIVKYGRLADNGCLKSEQTTRVVDDFNARKGGPAWDRSQINSQISCLKADYSAIRTLTEQSGFGWDPVKKCVTAPEEVWKAYLEKHASYKDYKGRSYEFYDELEEIYTGAVATGAYAASCDTGPAYKKQKVTTSSASAGSDSPIRRSSRISSRASSASRSSPVPSTTGIAVPGAAIASSSSSSSSSSSAAAGVGMTATAVTNKEVRNKPPNPKPSGKRTQKDIAVSIADSIAKIANKPRDEDAVERAMKLFKKDYSAEYTAAKRAIFFCELAKNPRVADAFIVEDNEGRRALIDNLIGE
jgi:Myb/SANT-like DNA-binding domain